MKNVRAKFNCHFVQKSDLAEIVHLHPVYSGSEENKRFSNATPGGMMSMTVSNPACFGFFQQGKEYYLDITPVEA